MTNEEVVKLFKESSAFLKGHFLLTSGLHSPHYFQCAKVLQYPWHAQRLCWEIAYNFITDKITAVVAPAIGGIVVAQEVARLIKARAIFTEREGNKMILRRGFEMTSKDNVLIVEDVITTGGSVKEIINIVQNCNAQLKGLGFLVDRTQGKIKFPIKTFSLLKMDVISYQAEECPLCRKNVPLVKPGSRK